MDRLGFIHDELDIKLLILFILRRLPGVVDPETLLELAQCDGGVGYFEYSDCLADLVDNGHIDHFENGYQITEKGVRNSDTVESSLPYSVRTKAERLLSPIAEKMRRDNLIVARHEEEEDGTFVQLSMSDGKGDIINLRLLVSGEEQARIIEGNFRREAESYYQKIVALLGEEKRKEK